MGGQADQVVEARPAGLEELARRLTGAADSLAGAAGGVDRAVPPVPEDEHGVGVLLIRLDEALERFDRRTADTLRESGRYLQGVSDGSRQADRFLAGSAGEGGR